MDRVERLLELFEQIQHLRLQPDAALVPLGDLTLSQVKALFYLWRCPGHLHKDLVAALGLTPASISIIVKELVNAGLVVRRPDPRDARALQLELTDAGRKLVEAMRERRRQNVAALLSGLTPEEQDTLIQLLERALANVGHTQPQSRAGRPSELKVTK